jgi:hypothetical protein
MDHLKVTSRFSLEMSIMDNLKVKMDFGLNCMYGLTVSRRLIRVDVDEQRGQTSCSLYMTLNPCPASIPPPHMSATVLYTGKPSLQVELSTVWAKGRLLLGKCGLIPARTLPINDKQCWTSRET